MGFGFSLQKKPGGYSAFVLPVINDESGFRKVLLIACNEVCAVTKIRQAKQLAVGMGN